MTGPEVQCCANKPKQSSDLEDERSYAKYTLLCPPLIHSRSNKRASPLAPGNQTEETLHYLTRLLGPLQGPASPWAPVTTTITDLQCLLAAVFNYLFIPGLPQPPVSQDPYDFSTFCPATYLHY